MVWQKGESGNPDGRPKGSPNKNCVSLRYWFNLIAENADDLKPSEKVEIAFRAVTLLLPKVSVLPADPTADPIKMIEDLEKENEPIEPGV